MAKNVLAICLMFLVASSVIYEVQGSFLLKMYLRKKLFPRRCMDFTPFACKGLLMLMGTLKDGCPATREFKEFFTKFTSYIQFIRSASVSSKSIDTEMTTQCDGLAKAMALLTAVKGGASSSSSEFKDNMMSMGKVLIQQKRSGTMIMSLAQKKELVLAMVRWTRMIATFVKSAAEQRGKSIDISNLGLDVDVNSSVGGESGGSTETDSSNTNTGSQNSGSPSNENESSASGSATSSRSGSNSKSGSSSGSGSSYKDTTGGGSGSGSPSGSPTGSPSGSTPSGSTPSSSTPSGSTPSTSGETSMQGSTSGSSDSSTMSKQSATEKSKTGSTKTGNVNLYKDTTGTGATTGSPSGSPTGSPSAGSGSLNGETSVKGSASSSEGATSKTNSESSSTTSVKQVESETSKEVMEFISSLEKKYAGKAELKGFFDILKTSMSVSSKLSTRDSKDFISGMKSAAGKLYEVMSSVRSKFSKSEETKTSMETSQEQFMKTLKELQDINSQIVSQSQGKTVTSTQQTELKQTITKWEQVTTQFVETAASSSSTSSSSQSQQRSTMNAQAS